MQKYKKMDLGFGLCHEKTKTGWSSLAEHDISNHRAKITFYLLQYL